MVSGYNDPSKTRDDSLDVRAMDSCTNSSPPASAHNPLLVDDDEYADSSDDEYVLRTTGRPIALNPPRVAPIPPTLSSQPKVEAAGNNTRNSNNVSQAVDEEFSEEQETPTMQTSLQQNPPKQGITSIQVVPPPPLLDTRPNNDPTHAEQPPTQDHPKRGASNGTLEKEIPLEQQEAAVVDSRPSAGQTTTLQSSEDQLMQDIEMEIQEQESSAAQVEPPLVDPKPSSEPEPPIVPEPTEDELMQDLEMEIQEQETSTRESVAHELPPSEDPLPSEDQANTLQSTEDQLMQDIEMEIQEQELAVQEQSPEQEYLSKEELELRQLEWEIQYQESIERNKHLPSQVREVTTADSPDLPKPDEIVPRFPTAPKRRRLRNKCLVHELEYDPIFDAKYKVPKQHADGSILFTPSHFYTGVVGPIVQWLATHHPFVHLRVHIRDHKGDRTSTAPYSVYCHGPRVALNAFSDRMSRWVNYRVTMANLQSLANDPENLMVDVDIPSTSRLRGEVPNFDELNLPAKQKINCPGVWFHAEDCNEGLPRLLGIRAFEAGCAITAVNWEPVNDQSALLARLAAAAEHRGTIKLSLCLSKYADTSRVDRVEHRLRRLDGQKFEPAVYEKMRLDWVMNQVKKRDSSKNGKAKSPPYLLYPSKPVPIPANLPQEQPHGLEAQKAFMKEILSNKRSVEVDVYFDPGDTRGIAMKDFDGNGMWCYNISPNSQLAKILGKAAVRLGVVLAKANSVEMVSAHSLATVLTVANFCQSKIRVTFVLPDGIDLSGLDKSCLLDGRINPRRRNGKPYPLHLKPLPKPKRAKAKRKRADSTDEPRSRTSSFDSAGDDGDVPLAALKKKKTKKIAGDGTSNETTSSESKKNGAKRQKPGGSVNSTNGRKLTNTDTPADMVDKKKSYDNFIAKYKDTVIIEYEGYIQNKQAFSSMWKQHRTVQGENKFCDDDCTCVGKLPRLVRNVIGDFIGSQSKKGVTVDEAEIRRVGFARWFSKRFLPELKNEYPLENPRQLLNRLVAMWRIHVKHPTYGLTCSKDCKCGDEWNGIFMRGRNENDEHNDTSTAEVETSVPSIPKKTLPDPSSPPVTDQQSTALPRKGKTTSVANLLSRMVDKAEANTKLVGLPPLSLFDVTFDTSLPLGVYFLDIIGKTNVCKVQSVDPSGQGHKLNETNLVKGITVITASVEGGQIQHISSSTTLKDIYFDAKKKERRMRISFQTMKGGYNSNQNDNDWNGFGVWVGRDFEGGWDGVSATVKPVSNKEVSKDKNPKTKPVSQPQAVQPIEPVQESDPSSLQDGWILRDSQVVPKHRTQGKPVSLLRESRISEAGKERTKKRLVQFNGELVQRRDYVTTSQANQVLECTSPDALQGPQQTLYEKTVEATKSRKCKDLVDALNSGSSSGQSLKEPELRYLYNLTKDLYTAADAKFQRDPSDVLVENEMKDLVAKRAVLNVQLSSAHYIEMAMSLKYWTKLEMKVCHIEMLRNRSLAHQQIGFVHGLAKLRLPGRPDQVVGEIPSMEFQEFLLLDEEGQSIYEISNNSSFKLERRQFILEFLEESSGSKLCSFSEPLNVIDELCPQSAAEIHHQIRISETNDKITGGNLELKIRRKRPEIEFIQDKRAQAEKGLRERINTIESFNEDFSPEEYGRLSGNIVVECGASLLHAAINLQNLAMVEALVALGADPFVRSEIGTPLGLAVKFREKTEEKLERMKMESENPEKPGFNPETIARTEELLDLFNQIVGVLKGSNLDAAETASNEIVQEGSTTHHTIGDNVEDGSTNEDTRKGLLTNHSVLEGSKPDNVEDAFNKITTEAGSSPIMDEATEPCKITDGVDKILMVLDSSDYRSVLRPGTAALKRNVVQTLLKKFPYSIPNEAGAESFLRQLTTQGSIEVIGAGPDAIVQLPSGSNYDDVPGSPLSDLELLLFILRKADDVPGCSPGTAASKAFIAQQYAKRFPRAEEHEIKAYFQRIVNDSYVEERFIAGETVLALTEVSSSDSGHGEWEESFMDISDNSTIKDLNEKMTRRVGEKRRQKVFEEEWKIEFLFDDVLGEGVKTIPGFGICSAEYRDIAVKKMSEEYTDMSIGEIESFIDRVVQARIFHETVIDGRKVLSMRSTSSSPESGEPWERPPRPQRPELDLEPRPIAEDKELVLEIMSKLDPPTGYKQGQAVPFAEFRGNLRKGRLNRFPKGNSAPMNAFIDRLIDAQFMELVTIHTNYKIYRLCGCGTSDIDRAAEAQIINDSTVDGKKVLPMRQSRLRNELHNKELKRPTTFESENGLAHAGGSDSEDESDDDEEEEEEDFGNDGTADSPNGKKRKRKLNSRRRRMLRNPDQVPRINYLVVAILQGEGETIPGYPPQTATFRDVAVKKMLDEFSDRTVRQIEEFLDSVVENKIISESVVEGRKVLFLHEQRKRIAHQRQNAAPGNGNQSRKRLRREAFNQELEQQYAISEDKDLVRQALARCTAPPGFQQGIAAPLTDFKRSLIRMPAQDERFATKDRFQRFNALVARLVESRFLEIIGEKKKKVVRLVSP